MVTDFARFVGLLKNLRGILYYTGKIDTECIKWIRKRYKYRAIGVPESLMTTELRKSPFVEVSYPIECVEQFCEMVSKSIEMEKSAIESVILSSCYVTPLIILNEKSVESLAPMIVWTLRGKNSISDLELKRHIRIASYVVLDFHPTLVNDALDTLKSGEREKLRSLREYRKKFAEEDGTKRFWRLISDDKQRIWVVYLDIIRVVQPVKKLRNYVIQNSDISIGLSLSCGVVVCS